MAPAHRSLIARPSLNGEMSHIRISRLPDHERSGAKNGSSFTET